MEKCNKENSHVVKPVPCYDSNHTKSYKPVRVQYYTFGKDNCLVHHPATQSKKNTPSAIFCKTNPFSTQPQANKPCYKKVKSTLPVPKKQVRFLSQTNAVKQNAISKITRNLKLSQTSSVSNSDLPSLVVRGASLKLEPKKHFEVSACCDSGYCPSIKRCKLCGEVMHILSSSTKNNPSRGSCSACLDKKTSSIVCKERVENVSHQHNPVIKRCIICLKLFKQSSGSIVCEKCPTVERTKELERDSVFATKSSHPNKPIPSKTNLDKKVINVMPSKLRQDYIETFTKYKASQSTKSNKLPSKSKDTMEDLLLVRCLSSKQLKTKTNSTGKTVSKENSFKPVQTKLSNEANRLTTKAKGASNKSTSKGNVINEQCKNTNITNEKAKVSNMPTFTKLFKSNLASKCRSAPEETISKIYLAPELCKRTNTANLKASFEKSNISAQTKSLPENNQLITSERNANELSLKNYSASQQAMNMNPEHEVAGADKSTQSVQTNSLSETNLDYTISDNSSESFTSEGFFNREQTENSTMDKKKPSTEESNTVAQTSSLSVTSEQKSKRNPENYLKQSKDMNETNKEESVETPIHSKPLQLHQDILSKINTNHHNKDKNGKDETPIIQNVTINNYYYLTGSDLKGKYPNLPVDFSNHSSSTTKHSSTGSISVSSETEDSLEIDNIQDQLNKCSFYNQARYGHLKSSSDQLEFPKSVSEKLGGVFKQNTDDFFSNIFKPQCDKISFSKDTHLVLKNDACLTIDRRCDLSNDLYCIGKQEMSFQNCNQAAHSLYGTKTNPYIQKSLMIFEEMDSIRNEPIDPEKILEELKQNSQLMKSINQMAAKKLNISRKATVFKDVRFK